MKSRLIPRSPRHRRTRGSILPLVATMLVALMGSLAFVADVGQLAFERARLQHACDAAALAGGMELPAPARNTTYGNKATQVALDYVAKNDPTVGLQVSDIGFRCIVGDINLDGKPDAGEMAAACPQVASTAMTCQGGLCAAPCNLTASANKCNSIVIDGHKDVPFRFARVLGLQGAKTVSARSTACAGACGGSPTQPLDVGIIIDRSSSMSATDLANVKTAALAVLKTYDPSKQYVALGVLGAADASNTCNEKDPSSGSSTWVPVGLSSDYKSSNGTLNTGSKLVTTINCLQHSSQGTNLGSPLKDLAYSRPAMIAHLQSAGRANVKKGIIFMTDGAANEPTTVPGYSSYTNRPCKYADAMADAAKTAGIEIFTIGFGIETELCTDIGAEYAGDMVSMLLADMADDSKDDKGHCVSRATADAENLDGDHLLCEPRTEDLTLTFKQAANRLAGGVRLVPLLIP